MIKNMDTELISVIMGIYNCQDTLAEAIESIVVQSYPHWEIILCDDCSTDNTYAVAKSYVEKYPDQILLLKNETNSRLSYSLNRCLQHAKGRYVARMDGDDRSQKDRFEKQIAYLQSHPKVDLVGTAMQRFDHDGVHDVVKSIQNPTRFTLRNKIPFHHATIMTYRCVYEKLGGYTVAKRTMRAQDYDLWFRFYHQSFVGDNLQDVLYLVREDPSAIRRRTFIARHRTFQTTIVGFRLLGFPKWWLLQSYLEIILKSLTPYVVVEMIRKVQAKHIERGKG